MAVTVVNAQCVAKEKEQLLVKLEKKITAISDTLADYNAVSYVFNKELKHLHDIKKLVQDESQIPNMHYQLNKADDAVDTAIEIIEKAAVPPVIEGKEKLPPPAKPIQYVTAATKTFLESEADVNSYLDALRKELMAAIQGNNRVKVK